MGDSDEEYNSHNTSGTNATHHNNGASSTGNNNNVGSSGNGGGGGGGANFNSNKKNNRDKFYRERDDSNNSNHGGGGGYGNRSNETRRDWNNDRFALSLCTEKKSIDDIYEFIYYLETETTHGRTIEWETTIT